VPQNGSPSALAFYRAPPPEQTQCAKAYTGLQQVINDCGPALPTGVYQSLEQSLQRCVTDRYLTQAEVTSLESEYMHLWTDCHPQLPHRPQP
jgi:hypothetical protein